MILIFDFSCITDVNSEAKRHQQFGLREFRGDGLAAGEQLESLQGRRSDGPAPPGEE